MGTIYLYPFTEPVTNRPGFLPITVVDSSDVPGVLDVNFVENFISNTKRQGDNDCTHYHIKYSKPNSSIEANWFDAGGTYHFDYDGMHNTVQIEQSGIVTKQVMYSGWAAGTVDTMHYVFTGMDQYGNLSAHIFRHLVWSWGQVVDNDWESGAFAINCSMWGGTGYMFRSYNPTVYSGPDPSISEVEKIAMISSITSELDSRLSGTPPESEVFRAACNSIGNNMNSIANLVEGVDFINDLLTFKVTDLIDDMKHWSPKKIKRALSSGWMGYRYSYSTTKADIEGMTDYLLSYVDPNNFSNLKRYAQATNEFGTTRCKVVFSSGDPINNTLRTLETTGMMLNAYAVWDMVPLSFIVDWFLPIGDFLEDLSSNWVSQPSVFTFQEILFSRKTILEDSSRGISAKAYKRWVSKTTPAFETYSSSPSSNTIVKRVFDGLSLTVGG